VRRRAVSPAGRQLAARCWLSMSAVRVLGGAAKARKASRTTGGLRGRCCPRGAISVATRSAAPGSARVSALRGLTCRGCLNAATAGSVVSSAARPWREHRSGVGAQRRPPQHEPPRGQRLPRCANPARKRPRANVSKGPGPAQNGPAGASFAY